MAEARRPGRPRRPEVHFAILSATRALLVDGGYAAVSMDRVAARAGVGIQTVYRRWPSKAPLVVEAVLQALDGGFVSDIPVTDHVSVDLSAWMLDVAAFLAEPHTAAMVGSLTAAAADCPDDIRELYDQLSAAYHEAVLRRLRCGVEVAEIREDANLPSVASAVIGFNLFRALSPPAADHPPRQLVEGFIDVLISGLGPR